MKANTNVNTIKKQVEIGIIPDVSGSLKSFKTNLSNALRDTIVAVKTNPELKGYAVTLTIITFDDNKKILFEDKPIEDISPDEVCKAINSLPFEHRTNPGPAIEYAVTHAMSRYDERRQLNAAHPMVYFFTDGKAGPNEDYKVKFKGAISQVNELVKAKKLTFITAAFGSKPDLDELAGFSGKDTVISISDNDVSGLERFFKEIIPATSATSARGTDVRDVLADLV